MTGLSPGRGRRRGRLARAAGAPVARLLGAVIAALIGLGAPPPAWAQEPTEDGDEARRDLGLLHLRPTLNYRSDRYYGKRRAESRRLAPTVAEALAAVAGVDVLPPARTRQLLGRAVSGPCRANRVCRRRQLRPLWDEGRDAVLVTYYYQRRRYHVRAALIENGSGRIVTSVQFSLDRPLVGDVAAWSDGLAELFPERDTEAEDEGEDDDEVSDDEANLEAEAEQTFGVDESAADEDWFIDDSALETADQGIAWHGHFQSYSALGIGRRFEKELVLLDHRLLLEFDTKTGPVRLVGKPLFEYFSVDERFAFQFRELYGARYWENVEIHVGQRIVSWGVTDFWPVVDLVNPRDYSRMRNWRPIDEKLSIPMLEASLRKGKLSLEALVAPHTSGSRFQTDPSQPFSLPIPVVPGGSVEVEPIDNDADGVVAGASAGIQLGAWTAKGYGLLGRDPLPSIYVEPDPMGGAPAITVVNERVAMAAASLEGPVGTALFKAEGAYYQRVDDPCAGRRGEGPGGVPECFYVKRVPTGRATVALEKTIAPKLDAHIQGIVEVTSESELEPLPEAVQSFAPGFPAQRTVQPIVTLRLEAQWLREDLRPMFFGYWAPEDEDLFADLDIEYRLSDGLAIAAGVFLFLGYSAVPGKNEYTFAGTLENSSNLYVRATGWF